MTTRPETKRASIERMLRDPSTVVFSDGYIAREVGSSYTHVSKTRRTLELAGEIEILDTLDRGDGTRLDRSEVAARRRREAGQEGLVASAPQREHPAACEHAVEAPTLDIIGHHPIPPEQAPEVVLGPRLVCHCSSPDDLDEVHALLDRVDPPECVVLVWDASAPPPLPALGALTQRLGGIGLELTPVGVALHPGDLALFWVRPS